MTINNFLAKVAKRTSELADMKMMQLRMEHPDSSNCEYPNAHNALVVTQDMTRGKMIEDILIEEFSYEFDIDIEEQEVKNEN